MPIAIVSVPVREPQTAKRFYTDVMGFTLLREHAMGPEMTWIQLQPKDGGCTITLTTWFDRLTPGTQQGLLLGVADIDAEHARLTALGVECSPIGEQPWGRATTMRDLDGNFWAVAQIFEPDC